MPKNMAGGGNGGKNRKKGAKGEGLKRELITREDGQEYGICTAMQGCNRIKVHLFSGLDVLGVIRGKIVRRMWINLGNVVLCGNREFQSGSTKVDIILRYSPDEASELQRLGQIPDISRWSVVGRGGMVEENEDGSAGNIKFTSSAGAAKEAKATNDGWEMPSSEEDEEDEEEEDEEGEEEESDEDEPLPDSMVENTYRKEDRHKGKQEANKADNARHKLVKANQRGDRDAKKEDSPVKKKKPTVAPGARPTGKPITQQKYVAPLPEDGLDIDGI